MKKLTLSFFLPILMGCSLLLGASESEGEPTREPAGARALPFVEHIQIQEKREFEERDPDQTVEIDSSKMKQISVQTSVPSDDDETMTKSFDKKIYVTTHEGAFHRPIVITINGDTVELEDGSCWQVYFFDRNKTLDWFTTDRIIITQNMGWFSSSSYYYELVNLDKIYNNHVRVNLVIKPFYNGYYTHWITAIDPIMNEVYLDDGTIWAMDPFDHSMIRDWRINDTVIIGVNACDNPTCPPNLLINAQTLEYGRGTCLNYY